MSEPLTRRSLLMSLAGAGLSLSAAGVAAAGGSPDPDRQARELENTLRTLERAGDQLVEIAADWVNPPDVNIPGQRALLDQIRTEAATLLAIVSALETSLTLP